MTMGDMIANGTYMARAAGPLVWGKSEVKGTPQVTVTFRIEDEGPFKGRLIEWRGYMTDATRERTGESLAILGYDPLSENPDVTVVRNVAAIVIESEDYTSPTNGKVYTNARVKWINDPNRGRMSSSVQLDEAEKQVFRDSMKGIILAQREARAKREGATSTPAAPEVPAAGVANQKAMF
jgi:hypothetical protein